jgi:hypothetical protein
MKMPLRLLDEVLFSGEVVSQFAVCDGGLNDASLKNGTNV